MHWQPSHEVIAGRKVGWVLEADLENFFGSLDHGWLLRFVEHRVGDPRIISLIRRWLKAGVFGRRGIASQRGRNPTRRVDQRLAEQPVPALCARPVV